MHVKLDLPVNKEFNVGDEYSYANRIITLERISCGHLTFVDKSVFDEK
jgi:hypothetical protein